LDDGELPQQQEEGQQQGAGEAAGLQDGAGERDGSRGWGWVCLMQSCTLERLPALPAHGLQ
jgi:hypothetical protein